MRSRLKSLPFAREQRDKHKVGNAKILLLTQRPGRGAIAITTPLCVRNGCFSIRSSFPDLPLATGITWMSRTPALEKAILHWNADPANVFTRQRTENTIAMIVTENGRFQEGDLKEPPTQSLQRNDLKNVPFQILQDYLPILGWVFQVDLASE